MQNKRSNKHVYTSLPLDEQEENKNELLVAAAGLSLLHGNIVPNALVLFLHQYTASVISAPCASVDWPLA